jgi:hypothetical protein
MAIWLLLLTYNGKTDRGQNEEIKDCGGKSTGAEAQGRGEGEAGDVEENRQVVCMHECEIKDCGGKSTGAEAQGRGEGEAGDVEENSASSMHA